MSIPLAFAETPKWGAHLDFEGRWGNARSLGDAGLFAPLWQSSDTLFLTDTGFGMTEYIERIEGERLVGYPL